MIGKIMAGHARSPRAILFVAPRWQWTDQPRRATAACRMTDPPRIRVLSYSSPKVVSADAEVEPLTV